MSKDTQQIPATYSVRLPIEMRRRLEDAAQMGGRSLHAEILMRLETSLSPSRLDWRKIIDPAVCSILELEASTWGTTFEEALSYQLQQRFDENIAGLFLEDLSSTAMARKMTVGQVLDERLMAAAKKHQDKDPIPQPFYPFSDVNNFQEYKYGSSKFKIYLKTKFQTEKNDHNDESTAKEAESLMRQIVREELAKAGITIPNDELPKEERAKGKGK